MKPLMAAIALLLLSEAALCSSWSYVGGAYPHAAFIETTTISDDGQDTKGFWIATINVDKALPFDTVVSYMQVKCPQRQLRTLQSDFYLRGKRKWGDGAPAPWQRIIPDTMGGRLPLVRLPKIRSNELRYPGYPRYGSVENCAASNQRQQVARYFHLPIAR